ncbi:MAG: hypothetical protein N4A41_14235 [Crocinitomicaceae bacterium]|jgi:hypothetical protein|nr:hypothetical protein [Crocinitomicaceae bacterium]
MKKLAQKIAVFIGLVILLFGFNYLYNSWAIKKPYDLGNCQNLIIGDSRVMTALNPELIPFSVNTAQNSESYFISYHKLKSLLATNTDVSNVILGFSYPSLSAYLDGIYDGDMATGDIMNRIYPIVQPTDFGNIPFDLEKYRLVWFRNMLVYPHNNHHKYVGGFESLEPNLANTDLMGIVNRHYYNKEGNFVGTSATCKAYLDSIIALTTSKNIDLYLINIPLQKEYTKKVPKEIVHYFEEVKKEVVLKGVHVLDYGSLPFVDKDFKDHNHLSKYGAAKISEIVKKDLLTSDIELR